MIADLISDNQLYEVKRALLSIGYQEKAIVADYDFAAKNGHDKTERVDLVAFSDPVRHDLQTACIAVDTVASDSSVHDALRKISFLAAPFALLRRRDSVELWRVRPANVASDPEPLERISSDRIVPLIASNHKRDLSPEAIAAAKRGGVQLAFCDVDPRLLDFAVDATNRILEDHFQEAVAVAKPEGRTPENEGIGDSRSSTKLALQLLAAAILEDKQVLGGARSVSAMELLAKARKAYSKYFTHPGLAGDEKDLAEQVHVMLRRGITFRSFTTDMLSYFYESALVNSDLRKKLGIYYTPRHVARRILSRLPIEEIPPQDRRVLDGTCGSGTLLLAAYERLADLLPKSLGIAGIHQYMVERIHGVDVDPFAAEVARLSLLLISLPAGDSWDIRGRDFISLIPGQSLPAPTIIVGNPPFEDLPSISGKRQQKAVMFLEKYLDHLAEDGLLGIVLPESFVETSSCSHVRKRLLTECDVLELWHLPERVFPMSESSTVVVLARKKSSRQRNQAVKIERVGGTTEFRSRFKDLGTPTFAYVLKSQREWQESRGQMMTSSPLSDSFWSELAVSGRLGDIAEVKNGIKVGSAVSEADFSHEYMGPEWKPWLKSAKSIEPYWIDWRGQKSRYVRYPGKLDRPRTELEHWFATPGAKILINSSRRSDNPWRLVAALDVHGLYPSNGFDCVFLRPNPGHEASVSLEEMAAVLNSPVANAWIDAHSRSRGIATDSIRSIPLPRFSPDQSESLVSTLARLRELRQQVAVATPEGEHAGEFAHEVSAIDELVFDAFCISDKGRRRLSKYFASYRRPGWGIAAGSETSDGETSARLVLERRWRVTGQVVQVSPEADTVRLIVDGYNDGDSFDIRTPESMPGWALSEGTSFTADVPWEHRQYLDSPVIDLANFRPLEFGYMSTEDLSEMLSHPERLDLLIGHGDTARGQ